MKQIEKVKIGQDRYFKISNNDRLRPFFMSIVSDSNHWMFISSNGGLTAGRKNSDFALFPYYTDDKITETAGFTGSKSIFMVEKDGKQLRWEPFSKRQQGVYNKERNLYKSIYGNKILFEEINHDLQLQFRYEWCSSNKYGFVRKSSIKNLSDEIVNISFLDGVQNILPYGVSSDLQNRASNLVDAYKRSELDPKSGLAVFALSAIIVDKAEPSEALKANVAWSMGLENPTYLVSARQVNDFRVSKKVAQETDVKGEKGSYFLSQEITLDSNQDKEWAIVANVNQNHAGVAQLQHDIQQKNIWDEVFENVKFGTEKLIKLNASSDGLQCTADDFRDARHFSNTLFNIMRGGIFDDNYQIEKWDFENYLKKANHKVFKNHVTEIASLPEIFTLFDLKALAEKVHDADFKRLAIEYLPLKFSRRHGDPSRPWNRFSINTRSEVDGSKILDYEGNWRDIYQNWEALAYAFPEFMEGMIYKFLNTSTFDGYNPYRVTKDGFDWETIEPDDPWSYIGYWGDHQIIYLLKFLEFIEKHQPGKLNELFTKEVFVYAAVPYIIKPYQDILKNPKDTIDFDEEWDARIRKHRDELGADGALITDEKDGIYHVNFIEKILATVLAKMSNFIPEGGIWMNTQRPEWNDANNALVGNGVSMVTLYYLRRFMKFFEGLLENAQDEEVKISGELVDFYHAVRESLVEFEPKLKETISDADRKTLLDKMGKAASEYRHHVYQSGFWGKKRSISINGLKRFTNVSLNCLEQSIRANMREDKMFHAYNLMTPQEKEVNISYLSEMLEGQVAALSSFYLSPQQALDALDAMKNSALFRPDQYSYLLYPNKELKGFFEKNIIPEKSVKSSDLLQKLVADGHVQIIEKDINGKHHFNGNFKNASDLTEGLAQLEHSPYADLAQKDRQKVLDIFEEVFNHKEFTGRSGTFFGYEGLGSIYWHMVSKLLLAVQEVCLNAIEEKEDTQIIGKLLEHYYEIQAGIGVHKSPELYGAFPTDPYSHTPGGKGAQQPGMTGQVKEDILSRFGELGAFVKDGKLFFYPCLLRKNEEFLKENKVFEYVNIQHEKHTLELKKDQLGFTYCQVPVIYALSEKEELSISYADGKTETVSGLELTEEQSKSLFHRTGEITKIQVYLTTKFLK